LSLRSEKQGATWSDGQGAEHQLSTYAPSRVIRIDQDLGTVAKK
jgi:hypothetical protein